MIGLIITSNADKVLQDFDRCHKALRPEIVKAVAWGAIAIRNRSTGSYFLRQTGPPDSHRLTSRTGFLRRRIFATPAEVVENSNHQLQAQAFTGTNVKYGAIHEFGGVVHPQVTAKSRGFAWWKYRETNDDKWKWLALTKKTQLDITIPERPFLRSAATDEQEKVVDRIGKAIHTAYVEGK